MMGKQDERNSKRKTKNNSIAENYWPKVMISRESVTRNGPENEETSGSKEAAARDTLLPCLENFKEEKISSSTSELPGDEHHEGCVECQEEKINVNFSEPYDLETENRINYSECKVDDEQPIFVVDLTSDERSNRDWKQTILDRFSSVKKFTGTGVLENEHSTSGLLERRIMIADSSSSGSHRGPDSTSSGTGLAFALKDRNRCAIPIQPNRSLPIRPPPTSFSLLHIETGKKRRKDENDKEENKKRKRSAEEADSSETIHVDRRQSIIVKEFSKNPPPLPPPPPPPPPIQLTEKKDSTTDHQNNANKLVPPLRLKKVVRSETSDGYGSSEISTETENDANYRIVTGGTPRPSIISWENDRVSKKRLKEKLADLRGKLGLLVEQMANPSITEDDPTRLRQTMNRYEKQIENLSKLLDKLPTTELSDAEETRMVNSSVNRSPEPPKLSPRHSPLNDRFNDQLRNSPPILPRVCLGVILPTFQQPEIEISALDGWTDHPENENSHPMVFDRRKDETGLTDDGKRRKENEEERGVSSQSVVICKQPEKIGYVDAETGPIVSSVIGAFDKKIFQSSSLENAEPSPSNYYAAEDDAQKITSSSNKVSDGSSISANHTVLTSVKSYVGLQKNSRVKGMQNNCTERNEKNNRIMSEQFPTLGNWVARMSKKQSSKSAFNNKKLQGTATTRITVPEVQQKAANNFAPAQWHQQSFDATVAAASQPIRLPGAPPPISMTQFYPNAGYATIDPYSGTGLSYHSAICPYGSYPYHARLQPLTGYQESFSPTKPPFSVLRNSTGNNQFTIDKCPLPVTGLQQQPSNVDLDRLRRDSNLIGAGAATRMPPFFLAQPSAPPRTGFPTNLNNGQFTQNRMIPDVVAAAAAAAAVVAAASFDRQQPFTGRADAQSTVGNFHLTGEQPSVASNLKKQTSNLNRDTNVNVNVNLNEQTRLNGAGADGYRQFQNLIFDRFAFIDQPTAASTHAVNSRFRSSETPHLGKVDRPPNILSFDLACSNCGVNGPMFKCLGCETAFYCNERCQTRHWTFHVEKCPKKMPKLKKVS